MPFLLAVYFILFMQVVPISVWWGCLLSRNRWPMLVRTGRITGVGASVIYICVLDCIMNASQEEAQLALELQRSDFWYSLFEVLAYLKIKFMLGQINNIEIHLG